MLHSYHYIEKAEVESRDTKLNWRDTRDILTWARTLKDPDRDGMTSHGAEERLMAYFVGKGTPGGARRKMNWAEEWLLQNIFGEKARGAYPCAAPEYGIV